MGEEPDSRQDDEAPLLDLASTQGDGLAFEQMLLREAVWATPPADLELRIRAEIDQQVTNLTTPVSQTGRLRHLARSRLALAAAVGVLATATGIGFALGGPTTAQTELAGTALAQGAGAEAQFRDTPSGVEITLDVNGLAPAPAGSYYQGWVKGSRGSVTIGTFHVRGGSDDVVLWSGVELRDYPTLTVTLQRESGGPASSNQVVLTGDVPSKFR